MLRKRRSSRFGFTLVELLVVIGTIAVLVAILIPTLARARASALRAACLSNQRQLVIAWGMFADENKDRLVRAQPIDYRAYKGKVLPWVAWPNNENSIRLGALWKYLRTTKVYHCPADVDEHVISYSINGYLNGDSSFSPIFKRKQIRQSSSTLVFIDQNDFQDVVGTPPPGNNAYGFMINPAPATRWIHFPGWWHSKGACLSFADGHAEWWQWVVPQTLKHNYADREARGDMRDLERLQAVRGG